MEALEHGFNLAKKELKQVVDAIKDKTGVILKLKPAQLLGEHLLPITNAMRNRLAKAISTGKGITLNLSNAALQRHYKKGGFAWAALAPIASAIAGPLISKGVNFLMDKISGKGLIVPGTGGQTQVIPFEQMNPGELVVHVGDGLFLPGTFAAYTGNGVLTDFTKFIKKVPGIARDVADYTEVAQNIPDWIQQEVKKKRA